MSCIHPHFPRGHLDEIKEQEGYAWVANGANLDDLGDFRPGLRAASEHQARSPLVEAGLNKSDVRRLAQELEIPVWDKPAQPCLSSRIPYGTPVTAEALDRIARAEEFLHEIGIRQLRVRHHDSVARIEVPLEDFATLMDEDNRTRVADYFRSIGYSYVTLDLEGFRSGSLNEVLAGPRGRRASADGKTNGGPNVARRERA